ncbi:MAG1360 family OppF-related protein [Mycoplasma sp. Mirounga ES2805-ORL]|uniref:MAG1360 family OppF-related protein n=1 Tax=Mycoplasma sp. Mirounga ES2805-ORL TaxID=754514 RepID=UPI00197C67EE|nr:hypothetical protein [Mycoplasma sp. Mirounga ES2805-ORL]QSF13841.1 hypothetical protein JXZ90_00880 [Mycoplasma sp. Mirounga ES2805-ORL]
MIKNKKLLIENNVSLLSTSDTKESVFIPKMEFENKSSSLLLCDKSDFLIKNFEKNIKNNNSIITFFDNENNNIILNSNDNNKIFNKVLFQSLNEIELNNDINFLFLEYNELYKNFNIDPKEIKDIWSTLRKFNPIIKNSYFDILKSHQSSLTIIFNDYTREINILKANLSFLDNEKIDDFEKKTLNFLSSTNKVLFDIYKEFLGKFNNYKTYTLGSVDYFGDEKIKQLKMDLFYLNQLKLKTKNIFKQELLLENTHRNIENIKDIQHEIIDNNLKTFNYIISWYKKDNKVKEATIQNLKKNSLEYELFIKKIETQKHAYKLLRKVKNKILLLDEKEIFKLKDNIDFYIKLFIYNNLASINCSLKNFSIKKIRSTIKKEFDFGFDQYIALSNNKWDKFKELLNKNNKEIYELKKNTIFVSKAENYDKKTSVISEKIYELENEYFWKIENTIFKLNAKLKDDPFLKKASGDISKKYTYIKKTVKGFISFFQRSFKPKGDYSAISKLAKSVFIRIKSLLDNYSFVIDYFTRSHNFLFNNKKYNEKEIIGFITIKRLIEVFDKSSISIQSIIKKSSEFSKINKLKIKLLSNIVKKPDVLFIVDDNKDIDLNLINEFLRVASELCEQSNITYIFITDRIELVNREFDKLFYFYENKLIEYGDYKSVLKKPFTQNLKNLTTRRDLPIEDFYKNSSFLLSSPYDISNSHFVCVPSSYIKNRLNMEDSASTEVVFESETMNSTIETAISEMTNVFDGISVFIDKEKASANSNKLIENYDKWINDEETQSIDIDANKKDIF